MSRWSLGRHTISAHVGGRPYPEEFKAEAVKQITERGHKVADVSARRGVSQHSLYQWIKAKRTPTGNRQVQVSQADELRRLKAELKRVTEERYCKKFPLSRNFQD